MSFLKNEYRKPPKKDPEVIASFEPYYGPPGPAWTGSQEPFSTSESDSSQELPTGSFEAKAASIYRARDIDDVDPALLNPIPQLPVAPSDDLKDQKKK